MPYEYVPAALFGLDHGGLGIYVKYGRPLNFVGDCIQVIERTGWYVWLKTPDRELVMVRDGFKDHQFRPLDANFDEYFSYSPFHQTNRDMQAKWYMINYFQHMSKGPQADFHLVEKTTTAENRPLFIADSGGFQIAMNKAEFINPADIAKWYHRNIDVGVALDIPVESGPWFIPSAHIQRKNTDLMLSTLDALDSKVQLMNVNHGNTYENQLQFHDIIQNDRVRKLCIGGLYFGTIVDGMDILWRVLDATKGHYDHYHVLGVYSILLLPSLIYLAKMRKDILLVTSDASTHLKSANMRMFHMQRTPEHPIERLIIGTKGDKASKQILSGQKHLPCSCSVCSVIKYYDVFSTLSGATNTFLMSMHNLNEIVRYTKMMTKMAEDLSFADYRKLVSLQLSNHGKGNRQESLHALDYIHVAATEGVSAARKRFSMYLHTTGLFAKSGKFQTFKLGEDEPPVVIPNAHYHHIFEVYNKFHASDEKTAEHKKVKQDKKGKTKRKSPHYTKHTKLSGSSVKSDIQKNKQKIAMKRNKDKKIVNKTAKLG